MPDVLGMLNTQLNTTREGIAAFSAWAHGDRQKSDDVRALEHRADDEKRELWRALRTAFITPIDAEDLFALSAGLDELLNGAKDAVREADVLHTEPDAAVAEMADLLLEGVGHLGDAFRELGDDDGASGATAAADGAVKCVRRIEHVYRNAMPASMESDNLRIAFAQRQLYTRVVAVSERLRLVAERVWYAVVKEA
jgi:uncharacterized protein Yka (UPF0111/DUF47 family)